MYAWVWHGRSLRYRRRGGFLESGVVMLKLRVLGSMESAIYLSIYRGNCGWGGVGVLVLFVLFCAVPCCAGLYDIL